MRPDGTRVRDLGRGMHSAKRADWSPDGRLIAFDGRDYVTFFDFGIFVARADGSQRRKLTRGPERDLMPAWSAWSPNGRTIAFTGSAGLATVNVDGTGARMLVAADEGHAWLPDGRSVVFTRAGDVWTMRVDGSAQRRLTRGRAQDVAALVAGRTLDPLHKRPRRQ